MCNFAEQYRSGSILLAVILLLPQACATSENETLGSAPASSCGQGLAAEESSLLQALTKAPLTECAVCNPGYTDVTQCHAAKWQCGGDCQGGQYWVDYTCACACKPKEPSKPRCVFIHGTGTEASAPPSHVDTVPGDDGCNYWSCQGTGVHDLSSDAVKDACSEVIFITQQTTTTAWWDKGAMENICRVAKGADYKPGERNYIENTVIITHSFGNLMFAGALLYKVCDLSWNSWWFSSAAPWTGSSMIDVVERACAHNVIGWLVHLIVDNLGYCDGELAKLSYRSEGKGVKFVGDGTLRDLAVKYVDGAICGSDCHGYKNERGLCIIDVYADFPDGISDGMVGLRTCKLPYNDYKRSRENYYFEDSGANHKDLAFRNDGDAVAWLKYVLSNLPKRKPRSS